MPKKGAIGLSVNLLVTVLISLVILSGGIVLLYKFIGGAEDIKNTLDTRTEQELERLLIDEGKKIAFPKRTATIFRGETHLFGLGILNLMNNHQDFSITIEFSKAFDETEKEILINKNEVESWILYNKGKLIIEENQHHTEPILAKVPKNAKKGTYLFNLKVWQTLYVDQYDNTKKLNLVVK